MKNLAQPALWDQQQTADYLGVSTKTVSNLRKQGLIAFIKVGSRVRFHPDDVSAYLQSSRQQQGNN